MITLEHVRTEMSLHVLAYNMKRVMNILGVHRLLQVDLTGENNAGSMHYAIVLHFSISTFN